ncbi:von Willebrand factor type A domain-containing protein [uncultured Mucilaginibacter sp.]|uniref:YfbK domain-containing protein n=1 Tax=uncultured Mucilaginibacter sp. TaxID=797541 RepID=UPI0025EEB1FE|nr:von Willebrand factor type A domain-containing protein [uncultured Mucilaginibacter sp.]
MKKILLLFIALGILNSARATDRTVTGHVNDANSQQPLMGVQVKLDDTKTSVLTNVKGAFSIQVPQGIHKLSFMYLGYRTHTIVLNKQSKLTVYLKPQSSNLKEIAVLSQNANPSVVCAEPAAIHNQLQGRVYGLAATAKSKNVKSQRFVTPIVGSYPGTQEEESYKGVAENGFQNPKDNPLSTFSVDVDAASYSNVRRFINNGQMPPKDAVRIEEMINYFNYNLPTPSNGEPVAIHTELSTAPWNSQHRLLRIGLKARVVQTDKLPASNLVFLVDVSGSMDAPNKLPLLQSSLKMLVDQLRPQDKVAIVVYAGAAGLILPSTPGNQKTTIKDAIDRLHAGGSTAGGEGIKLAYRTAKQNFLKAGNNRVILATDGDFNVGASTDEDMEKLIEQERKSGVFLSVLGYGMGNYKDSKMETLADKGNGNYAYIDNITEARKTLVTEFGGTIFTVAKDVKLQLEFNPAKVASYRLIGYENRMLNKEDFNNDLKDAGDMGAGHNVTALYEIIPAGVHDRFTHSVDPLKYQKQEDKVNYVSNDMLTIKFRYKEPNGLASKLSQAIILDKPVSLQSTSVDFRFAAAVAEVGMLLRESEFKQNSKYDDAIKLARAAKGDDHEGYRAEFIKLAESAKLLGKSSLVSVE